MHPRQGVPTPARSGREGMHYHSSSAESHSADGCELFVSLQPGQRPLQFGNAGVGDIRVPEIDGLEIP